MKRFRLADGRTLAYRDEGAGPPLVLVHGWSMSSAVFTEAAESLADAFRVLAPDLRGHGESDPGEGYRFTDFAGDLRQWLEALDLTGAILLGWSLGGQVSLELYPAVRERVARIILVDSTPRFSAGDNWHGGLPQGQVKAMGRNLKRDYRKTMEGFFALQFAGEGLPPSRYRRIIDFAVRSSRLPDSEVALAALEGLRTGDQRDLLAMVDCPVLVLHGELDRITPPEAGRYLAETLPRGSSLILKGVGHAPFLSRPAESFALWRQFCS